MYTTTVFSQTPSYLNPALKVDVFGKLCLCEIALWGAAFSNFFCACTSRCITATMADNKVLFELPVLTFFKSRYTTWSIVHMKGCVDSCMYYQNAEIKPGMETTAEPTSMHIICKNMQLFAIKIEQNIIVSKDLSRATQA